MKPKPLPSLEYLNECFILDISSPTGLIWKERPLNHFPNKERQKKFNTTFAGKPTKLGLDSGDRGYFTVSFWGLGYFKVHRIVFSLFHQRLASPDFVVDHIDGNTINNDPMNLREITKAQNNRNSGIRKDNFIGIRGVCPSGHTKPWSAYISINGKKTFLGEFQTIEEASSAYKEADLKYSGGFSRNN